MTWVSADRNIPINIRKAGYKVTDPQGIEKVVQQSMYFKQGDVLHVQIDKGKDFHKNHKTSRKYDIGYRIQSNDKLIGVLKSHNQVLAERGLSCTTRCSCKKDARRRELLVTNKSIREKFLVEKSNDNLQ